MDNRSILHNQLIKLGDMMGDGLHYEEPWISKEYKRVYNLLYPPTKEEKLAKRKISQEKNKKIDSQINDRILKDKCSCGGDLKQSRSGSKIVYCIVNSCGKRYKYKSRKK